MGLTKIVKLHEEGNQRQNTQIKQIEFLVKVMLRLYVFPVLQITPDTRVYVRLCVDARGMVI